MTSTEPTDQPTESFYVDPNMPSDFSMEDHFLMDDHFSMEDHFLMDDHFSMDDHFLMDDHSSMEEQPSDELLSIWSSAEPEEPATETAVAYIEKQLNTFEVKVL